MAEKELEGADALEMEEAAPAADTGAEPQVETEADPVDESAQDDVEGRRKDTPEQADKNRRIALRQEREERRRVERERDELRVQMARIAERTDLLLQDRYATYAAQQQQAPQQDPEPDPTVDPIGHQQWMSRQWNQARQASEWQTAAYQQQVAYQQQAAQQYQAEEQVVGKAVQQWNEAVQERPELNEAIDHVRRSLAAEYATYGYAGPALQQAVLAAERQHIITAARLGMPIDEYAVRVAQSRGWSRGQRMNENANAARGNASAQVERAARARDAGQSLSRAGGGAQAGQAMTAQRLASLSDEEFAQFRSKNPNAFRRMMGG